MSATTIDLTTLSDAELDAEEKRASAADRAERETNPGTGGPAWHHYIAVISERNDREARKRGFANAAERAAHRSIDDALERLEAASATLSNAAHLVKHRDEIPNDPVARAHSLYRLALDQLEMFAEKYPDFIETDQS